MASSQWAIVALTLSAALAFAASTSLKHISAASAPDARSLHPRTLVGFIRATLSHPLWLAGIGCDVIGLTLQLFALHLGTLIVVQPLLISGLVFALLLRHQFEGYHLTRQQFGWAIILTLTLAGFLLIAPVRHHAVAGAHADRVPATVVGLVGLVLAALCVELGRRLRGHGRSAALLGVAVGIIYAAAAALLKALTDIAVRSPVALLHSWQLYAVIAVGATGLFLNQLAFQAGPLSASLPATATVDPLLSIVVGVAVYDEHIHRGPGSGAVLIGMLLMMGFSVIQLARTSEPDPAPVT